MNKLLICFSFFTLPLLGQVKMINASLSDPTIGLIYAGVENFIQIQGVKKGSDLSLQYVSLNTKNTKYLLNAENSVYNSDATVCFIANPDTDEHECILKLYDHQKLIFHKKFEVWKIGASPVPVLGLGHKSGSVMSIAEIVRHPDIGGEFPGTLLKYFSAHGFKTAFIKLSGDTVTFDEIQYPPVRDSTGRPLMDSLGNGILSGKGEKVKTKFLDCPWWRLESKTIEEIVKLRPGDQLYIKDVDIYYKGSDTIIGNIVITIK